ncbi:MAG: DUF222 domain-containing protein [Candidatus Dormibacteria bacterium]
MGVGGAIAVSSGRSLAELVASVEAFAAQFRPAADPVDLGSELIQLRGAIDRLEVLFSQAVGTFAATDEYANQGATSPIEWVRHNCRMSGAAAARRVVVGEQLEKLPLMVDALEAGHVGFGHVVHAAFAARKLTNSNTGAGFDESDLLQQAEGLSVGAFYFAVTHYIHAQDPRGVIKDEKTAAELRELSISTNSEGWVHLSADLDPDGGSVVKTALEALAAPTGKDDDRSYERRMADALVEVSSHRMDTGEMPIRGGQRVHVQVTASYDTLKQQVGAPGAQLGFGLSISAEKARRLACDCNLTRVLLNSDSVPIDVGREKRVVSGAIRKAVHLLYPCCGFPGCERPASWTEAHHIEHWIDGGMTIVENLVPLCLRHHFMVHEGGWTIEKVGADALHFIRPSRDTFSFTDFMTGTDGRRHQVIQGGVPALATVP